MSLALLAEILLRLVVAVALGGALGMERSYHGRPAGFRTHALVGLASASLMLISSFESVWFHTPDGVRATIDPTRMAQGLMTGIGFLGAGVIMRHGPTVRGLTTAASIWITAAIGILLGIGFYFAAVVGAIAIIAACSDSYLYDERRDDQVPVDRAVLLETPQARDPHYRMLLERIAASARPVPNRL